MSEGKVGLSAALDATSSEKPMSAVSTIASQFNTASRSSTSSTDADSDKKVSDKVSSLATRFGKTIDDAPVPIKLSSNAVRRAPSKPKMEATASRVVAESNGKVTEVAKRFANPATQKKPVADGEAQGDGFASAHDMFRRAEEAEKRPAESKVSSFAKRIEVGATASFDATEATDTRVAGVTRTFESRGTDLEPRVAPPHAASLAAKFDNAAPKPPASTMVTKRVVAKEGRSTAADMEEEQEAPGNRFANAAKLFESGAANATKRVVKSTDSRADTEEAGEAAQTRFADAARMFGGL